MQNAIAFSNNDVITIAWSYGRKPEGCLGFAVYRIDHTGKEVPLPSHAVFPGYTIKPGQTTAEFPVQKFYWKDPYARLEAEKTGNRVFRYKIVPLAGKPGALEEMAHLPHIVSNAIKISPEVSPGVSAYFNRGILATQRVSRALKGKPTPNSLNAEIRKLNSTLRESLSGDMVEALTGFLDRASKSGRIYAALYELGDAQLIDGLAKLGKRLSIVLSNSVAEDAETGEKVDANAPARQKLSKAKAAKWDRIMPSGHIGHNKFLVYEDKGGKPRAVLLGSTNWTPNGLCAQTNNTLVLENDELAKRYLTYWKKLATDTKAAGGTPKLLQAKKLRSWDANSDQIKGAGGSVESWFSPNTPSARRSGAKNEKRPPDMGTIYKHILAAKQAILFLAFYPGTPSIANWSAEASRKNKSLFVRGCVTNKSASEGFYYSLRGVTPPKKVKGKKTPIKQDPRVIGAEALGGKTVPTGWTKELLKAGFAIIHDKILVIDPFSDECVVVTGSHNLGHKASFDNDENLVIVKGNKALAAAYTTHVLDVYDHFSWRYRVKTEGTTKNDAKLKTTPEAWQAGYFDDQGKPKTAQLKFWLSAAGNS